MYIDSRQFEQINVPKGADKRGLEPYIVRQHLGDKQVANQPGKGAYMYMNNPIYRIKNLECEPAPGSISSRWINNPNINLDPNESAIQLLYPRIDSGSVLLDEKHMNQQWWQNKQNITPTFSPSGNALLKDEISSEMYQHVANEKQRAWDRRERMIRSNPIYDQSRIADEIVPDGIRQINLRDDHLNDVAANCKCNYCINGLSHPQHVSRPFPNYVNTTEVPEAIASRLERKIQRTIEVDDIENPNTYPTTAHGILPTTYKSKSVEGFNYTKPQDYGHYGYPQPSGYSTMEGSFGHLEKINGSNVRVNSLGYNVDKESTQPVVPNSIEIPLGYKSGIHYVKPQYNPLYDVLDEGKTKNDDTWQKNHMNSTIDDGKEPFIKTPGRTISQDGDLSSQYRKAFLVVVIALAIILLSYIAYNAIKKGQK